MSSFGRARCPLCGAMLRRDRPMGAKCDPCARLGTDPRRHLPADFFDRASIVAALARYDFGAFFRSVRQQTGWSQTTLGGVIGLAQAAISGLERGEHRLRNVEDVAGVSRSLGIPPVRLNFPDIRATVGGQVWPGRSG